MRPHKNKKLFYSEGNNHSDAKVAYRIEKVFKGCASDRELD